MDHELNNTLQNWETYKSTVDTQILNMWNFMLYNQFNNEEVRRLHREMRFLKEDNLRLQKNSDEHLKMYLDELEENENLRKKAKRSKPKDSDTPEKVKPVTITKKNILRTDYNQFKKNNKLEEKNDKEINNLLKRCFSELESIEDIINLKDNPNKFYFIKNQKFTKLYNLIPVLQELHDIIGMDNVKQSIFESICYFLHNFSNNKDLNHVMITGPPGVGKTTIAKIIGKIYLNLGFLDNDTFNTARRSDLIAKYLGQTAIKTQDMIDKSIGGVLFIDEVYSLGNKEGRDSYAKECIDTINLNMTRDEKWLLIVGGYKEDIEKSFLSYNKGLERRFTVRLNIDGYTGEQLFDIFCKFVRDDKWKINDEKYTKDIIMENTAYFKYYAGDMQKVFQKAKEYYSLRIMKEHIDLKTGELILSNNDIKNSITHFVELLKKGEDIDNELMLSMYT